MEAPPTLSTPPQNQWSQPPAAPAPHWKPSDAPDPSKSFAEAMNGRPVHPASLAPQARASAVRFAPLSALPEGKGLPARRDEAAGPPAPIQSSISPRQLPGVPHASAARQPAPSMLPTALPAPQDKQIGFNCPSCMTILIIKQPTSYDGQPAPCPYCNVVILPPRIATPSPFKLLAPASQERLALPGGGAPARIPVGRPAPVSQPAPARKPGLPGAKSFARAAMF